MPDISMCQNKECSQRLRCYRYMAMPNKYRQAYGIFQASDELSGTCDGFLVLYPEHQHMLDKYAAEIGKEKGNE